MDSKFVFVLFIGVFLLTGCRKKAPEQVEEPEQPVKTGPAIHRLPEYNFTDTVRLGQQVYSYTLHREASDSLGSVCDEFGDHHVNNFYVLDVRKGGTSLFHKRFTKQTLGSVLSSDFLKNGILDGFRFYRVDSGKLVFSLCVSYPDSDLSAPFLLTVAPDGSSTIVKDEYMDVEPGEEDIP